MWHGKVPLDTPGRVGLIVQHEVSLVCLTVAFKGDDFMRRSAQQEVRMRFEVRERRYVSAMHCWQQQPVIGNAICQPCWLHFPSAFLQSFNMDREWQTSQTQIS